MTKSWPKSWPKPLQLFAVTVAVCLAPAAFCQGTENLEAHLAQAARQAHPQSVISQATVDIAVSWEKKDYYERRVRFHPGKKIRFVKNTEEKTTRCQGVLLEGQNRVLTLASCVKAQDGFEMTGVELSFSNGRRGTGSPRTVSVKDHLAYLRVSEDLTRGVRGLTAAYIPEGKTLADVYGEDFSQRLFSYFVNKGVTSPKGRLLGGRKQVTLRPGEPFMYEGKLVALFKEVPSKLPLSWRGEVAENALAVLRR